MTSATPPSLPPRPELPEGVVRPEPAAPEDAWAGKVPLWTPFAVALGAFVLATMSYGIIVAIAGLTPAEAEDAPGPVLGATLIQDLALIGGALGLVALVVRRGAGRALGLRTTPFWAALGWAFVLLVALGITNQIVVSAFGDADQEITQEIKDEDAALAIAGYIAITCLLAPLAEEMFFRGLLFPVLRARLGVTGGVLLTGLLFSVVHAIGSPVQALIVLLVFGCGLCLLYLRTGSLLPCIGVHALNNSIAFAVTKDMEWPVALVTVVGSVVVSVGIVMPFMRRPAAAPA